MSIYQKGDGAVNEGDLTQTEIHLYGSNRLGIYNVNTNVQCPAGDTNLVIFTRGNKFFELSNHLGNVLATISDKKIGIDDATWEMTCPCPPPPEGEPSNCACYLTKTSDTPDGIIDYYTADVVTANDYYPFGMVMPERKFTATSSYRYGFNGKENDNEVKGEGNQQDYGMRIYDVRLGRFLSVDPLQAMYAELTPYQFASNSPIANIDLDGLEKYYYTLLLDAKTGTAELSLNKVEDKIDELKIDNTYIDNSGTHVGEPTTIQLKNKSQTYYVTYSWQSVWRTDVMCGVETLSATVDYDGDPTKKDINNVIDDVGEVAEAKELNAQFWSSIAAGVEGHFGSSGFRKLKFRKLDPSETTNKTSTAANGGNVGAAKANAAKNEASTYNRVKPRKSTLKQVEANQPRNDKGQMIDPNTKKPLKAGEIDLGHKPGQEWRKRKEMHRQKGNTRKEVIHTENDPSLYQYEDRNNNRSHKFEQSG